MKLLEILITLLLLLTLVSSSELKPSEVAVSTIPAQTGCHTLPASELLSLLSDAVLRNDPNRVRTLLEDYVPLPQSHDEETLQQTASYSCVDTDISSQQNEFDINTIIAGWRTLLYWAADLGHSDLIPVLLTRGADIESKRGRLAMTPLMHAAWKGHDAVVVQLLNALATQPERMHSLITTQSSDGRTALHFAILGGHGAIVALLLDALATRPERIYSLITAHDDLGQTTLHYAADRGHDVVVAQLLNALAAYPERMYNLIIIQDHVGQTALHYAARDGHDVVAMQLLNALAVNPECMYNVITTQDNSGRTALYYASVAYNTKTVKMLLEHYKEALDKVTLDTSSSAARLPSTCNDSVNLVDREEMALHLPLTDDCVEIIDLLARLGANLNVRDEDGDTPLHHAAKFRCSAVVTALVTNGAESQKNNEEKTPLDVAQGLTSEAMSLLKECAERIILK